MRSNAMAVALLSLMDGEGLPSNLGRYAEYMGLKSTANLREKVFGYSCVQGTRLPRAIDYLAEQARDYWNMTGEEIVRNHTEFQYATMMSSESDREKVLKRMLGISSGESSALRILRFDGERSTSLRYCQECISESRSKGSPIYWKMDHQLIGAYVCATHLCVLNSVEFGHIDAHGDTPVMSLVKASDVPIICDVDSSIRAALEGVAKRSARVRCEGAACRSVQVYRDLLREAGFARTASLMRKNEVISAWSEFFGKEYCYLTGMSAARISAWLSRLTRQVTYKAPHPFMFIAAECFLEHLASLPGSYLPAEKTRLQKGAAVVEEVICEGALHRDSDVVKFAGLLTRSGGWKLVCTCGISYRLLDSSQSSTIKMMPFSYGIRYQNRFRVLMKKGANAKRASKELRLSVTTGAKWARRDSKANEITINQKEISTLRTEWRLLVKGISSERRISTAAEVEPALYKNLLNNDRDWLIDFNSRYRSWRSKSSYVVREPTIDEIERARRELLLDEPPVRSTATAIRAKVGFWGDRDSDTPASIFLAESSESRAAYLERVLSWLAKLAAEHRLCSCDAALRQAGLRLRTFTREQRRRIQEIDSLVVGPRE
jgi:hypothetical protein